MKDIKYRLRECKPIIRGSKRNYEARVAREAKSNPKQFSTYLRAKKKVKHGIGPLIDESGGITQDSNKWPKFLT